MSVQINVALGVTLKFTLDVPGKTCKVYGYNIIIRKLHYSYKIVKVFRLKPER